MFPIDNSNGLTKRQVHWWQVDCLHFTHLLLNFNKNSWNIHAIGMMMIIFLFWPWNNFEDQWCSFLVCGHWPRLFSSWNSSFLSVKIFVNFEFQNSAEFLALIFQSLAEVSAFIFRSLAEFVHFDSKANRLNFSEEHSGNPWRNRQTKRLTKKSNNFNMQYYFTFYFLFKIRPHHRIANCCWIWMCEAQFWF